MLLGALRSTNCDICTRVRCSWPCAAQCGFLRASTQSATNADQDFDSIFCSRYIHRARPTQNAARARGRHTGHHIQARSRICTKGRISVPAHLPATPSCFSHQRNVSTAAPLNRPLMSTSITHLLCFLQFHAKVVGSRCDVRGLLPLLAAGRAAWIGHYPQSHLKRSAERRAAVLSIRVCQPLSNRGLFACTLVCMRSHKWWRWRRSRCTIPVPPMHLDISASCMSHTMP